MQPTVGTVNTIKNTKSNDATTMPSGFKKAPIAPVSEAWLVFDTETKQEVHVEQPQSVKRPFLGPFETMLLAGLIVATLARHLVRGVH